jgi:translation initiation factor 1 (eIF-1/SUI1)
MADQTLRGRREKRHGKVVTVVSGFTPRSDRTDDLPALLISLKAKLGSGGTTSTEPGPAPSKAPVATLEIQGDHRDHLVDHFKSLGCPHQTRRWIKVRAEPPRLWV